MIKIIGPFCKDCNTQLTEYLGFGIKEGEGDWYCKTCESDGVPEKANPDDDYTPHSGTSWPPNWDLGFMVDKSLTSVFTTTAFGQGKMMLVMPGFFETNRELAGQLVPNNHNSYTINHNSYTITKVVYVATANGTQTTEIELEEVIK